MRMFLSVSGHSSELSIANHSSLPTASQLKCVSDTISNWFENHQPQKTKISTVIYAPLFQNSDQMPVGWPQPQEFREYFFISCNFQGNVQAFRLTGLLWWQKLTWFFLHFLQDFLISHFNFAFAISFHFTRNDARVRFDSGVIFLDQSQFFATHSTQWNCFILYRQWITSNGFFFVFARVGKGASCSTFFVLTDRAEKRLRMSSICAGKLGMIRRNHSNI